MSENQSTKKPTKGKNKRAKSPAKPPVAPAAVQTAPDAACETIEKLGGFAILGACRFTADSVRDCKDATVRAVQELIDDAEALVEGMNAETIESYDPDRDEARASAAQLSKSAQGLTEAALRIVRLAGRIEGLCEAVGSDRSVDALRTAREDIEVNGGTLAGKALDMIERRGLPESGANHG